MTEEMRPVSRVRDLFRLDATLEGSYSLVKIASAEIIGTHHDSHAQRNDSDPYDESLWYKFLSIRKRRALISIQKGLITTKALI